MTGQRLPPPLVLARVLLTGDADALLPFARTALDAADAPAGDWIARRAAALAPDQPWPYVVLAVQADGEAGVAQDRRLLRLVPEDDDTLRRLARRLAGRPDRAAAMREQRRALVDDPADPRALYTLALVGLSAGDINDGAAALARAVRLRPHWRDDAYTLGGVAANRGQVVAAATVFAALSSVAAPPPHLALPTDWPLALVAALEDGASLASVMIPDPRLPSNAPEYVENYRFDHVVVGDRCFWALPQPFIVDPLHGGFGAFAYCGDSRVFLRYDTQGRAAPGAGLDLKLYPGEAYKHFRFVVHHDHEAVYDSATPTHIAGLDAAIRSGAQMRVVLEDADGLVHVLPVHLCFHYLESGAVKVTTELRYAPEICLHPVDSLWPFFSGVLDACAKRTSFVEMLQPAQGRLAVRRLTIHSGGHSEGHYSSFDIDGVERRYRYRRVRIHALRQT